jgi:hypothetical protein
MQTGGDDGNDDRRVIEWSHAGREGPGLSARVQASIGAGLRAMYEELKDQPLPDRFLDLIAKLDQTAADNAHEG